MLKKTLFVLFILTLVLAACAPAAPASEEMMEEPTEAMMEKPTEAMLDEAKATPEPMQEDMDAEPMDEEMDSEAMDDEMMETPAWLGVPLTDVRTGENFTLSDFKGKVVLVETLAMWCPSCKRQQLQVKDLHATLGPASDLVSIGLDVDPNENAADLKAYTESNSFDWIYAVAPAEVAREIGNLYGEQFLNPPSTPILVIDRHGQVHPMPFGVKSSQDLMNFIEPFLAEGM